VDGNIFLILFLFADVFIMGALASTAVRHAYAHFHPLPHEPEHPRPHTAHPQSVPLPPDERLRMVERAKTNFQAVLDRSSEQLQRDLGETEARLTKQLEKLGTDIVGKEMERYHTELDRLRQQAEAAEKGATDALGEHQSELKTKMAEEVAAEKQHLIAQMDTKLGDAVASFLTETLQHNVDLGAQMSYITKVLEEHKTELKKEIEQ
jgi:hypothetical protein